MKKSFLYYLLLTILSFTLSGCSAIGAKSASISVIYGLTAILSFFLLIGYCVLIKNKNVWFLLLFSSVFIVNIGYFSLSISQTLEEALLANRISYLGSVFLPMSMLLIVLDVSRINYKKWFPALLLIIGAIVFLVAASPGYLNIYYKDVVLETINGVTVLTKTYGPWHCLYLFYLLAYFGTMIATVTRFAIKKELRSPVHATILIIAVFVNIGVWLIEQLVKFDFEFLSISYIISEFFLLGLHVIMTENERLKGLINSTEQEYDQKTNTKEAEPQPDLLNAETEFFLSNLTKLTKTERIVFDCYISGKTTKEVLAELNITENTLKFHNKNIYSKLEVSSRKQLIEIYRYLKN